ncbi:MAG: phosphotransferase family protein [Polyangiaceae bacterium]|nr:phosphotransferase family protein [Polyangiaceae bacterium]
MAAIDGTRPVRPGEELPLERLDPYLREALGAPEGEIAIEQFPGGHSNLTYLVRVGEKEAVLRRPPFGSKVKTAHDMTREFRVLSKLSPVYSRAPKPIALCEDESILGGKFYLMERRRGVIVRRTMPESIAADPAAVRALSESFVATLAELHAIDYQSVGLGDFGKPAGYVERQVTGWTKRYQDSQTDEIPEVTAVSAWLAENKTESPHASILHNDFKFDNLILDPAGLTKIIAILDWEMATVGDPLMDLGTSLCYWVEAGDPEDLRRMKMGPTDLPGSFTRRELAEAYAAKSGRDLGDIVFYYCFGLFKTAVVLQQIYYRYAKGLTKDPRFALMIDGVRALARQAAAFMGRREL